MKNLILIYFNKIVNIPYISYIIFTTIFFLFYGPYLLLIKLPGISPDTLQYTHFAMHIITGDIPIAFLINDIPIGYPVFLSVLFAIGGNTNSIVIVQTLLFLTACLFLIYQINKINKKAGVVFMILLLIWALDTYIMRQNTGLYVDSLYATSLVFLAASLINFFISNNKIRIIFVFMGIMFAMMIRSNGIYLFYIPAILILWDFFQKKYSKSLQTIAYTLGLIILLSSFNLILKGSFFPGDYHRIIKVTNRLFDNEQKPLNNTSAHDKTVSVNDTVKPAIKPTRAEMFKKYLINPFYERPAFYYSFLPPRYEKYKVFSLYVFEQLSIYDLDSIISFIYHNHDTAHLSNINFHSITDFNHKPRNPIMITHQILFKAQYLILHKTFIIIALYLILTLLSVYKLFKTKKQMFNSWMIILIISSIHFLSAIVLTFAHFRVQIRYINVSEFILYLTIVLAFTILITKKPLTTKQLNN